jgi:hypothetical protein
MKSIQHAAATSSQARLVCTCCGLVAQAGTLGWRALTAVSHAGPTLADELAGHEVALDLCRPCLRSVLKSALGIEPRNGLAGIRGSVIPSDEAKAALSSLGATEAYIIASNARLAAWRSAEGMDDAERG